MMSIVEWIPVLVAAVAAVGSSVASWISGRAGARRALEALAARVVEIEDERKELRAAHDQAEDAADEVGRLRADFEKHLSEESSRRKSAREIGGARDAALASKVDALAGDVREQGAQLNLLLDTTFGGRRGR